MQCENIKILLSTYIDKELPEAEEQQVEAHLLGCPDCAATLARLQDVIAAVRETPRLKLPPEAAERLAAAVDARLAADQAPAAPEKPAPWWHWVARPAFVSAATAIGVVAIAVALWQAPGQKSEWGVQKAPSGQAAPQVRENRKMLAPEQAPDGTTRQTVDMLVDQAAAGKLLEKDHGNADKKALSDEALGFSTKSGPVSANDAAGIAAANAPRRLLEAASGLYEGQVVWVVLVERTDKPGTFIGAVVSQKDGRVLYRKTRP